jgi:predicted DNA-binding protein (MmcQ/YjbR family)
MYTDKDRYLADVRRRCLAFPEATEVEAWGRPTFRAGKKMFAIFHGSGSERYAVLFKPDPMERPALVADERFFFPKYHGPGGWLGLALDAAPLDWKEVEELVDTSYRSVALKRMIRALEDRL